MNADENAHNDVEAQGAETLGLRITVRSELEAQAADLLFEELPVRIGRNALNDLVLNHPYVSQWHAVVGREGDTLTLMQMSTTNSVRAGTRVLCPNQEIALESDQRIQIVPFELRLQLIRVPPQLKEIRRRQPSAVTAAAKAGTGPEALQKVALQLLERMSQRFLGRTFDDPQQLAAFGARVEQTLDVFLRCLVALTKGQAEFRQALDIRALEPRADDPVEGADSALELASVLLSGGDDAVAALERAFKDIMIHQVALLNGLMAGVQNLLGKLSPATVRKEATRQHRSPGLKLLWETFERIHHDLAEEGNATFQTVFGRQFGRAYSTVARKKT